MKVHICWAGPHRVIVVNGRRHHFEMHGYCGPMNTNAKGDAIKPLPNSHPFWAAVSQWAQQGEQVAQDHLCVWDASVPLLHALEGK